MAKKSKKAAKGKRAGRKASRRVSVSHPVRAASQPSSEFKPHYAPAGHLRGQRKKHMVGGIWALKVAVLASVVLALVETPYLALVLVALGFVVGFLNFEHEETVKFLVATATLLVVASAVLLSGFSRIEIVMPVVALYLKRASYNVIAVVAPAAFVLSLKALRELAD